MNALLRPRLLLAQSSLAAPFCFPLAIWPVRKRVRGMPTELSALSRLGNPAAAGVECDFNMPCRAEYAPEAGWVVLTASGEMRDEDARALTAEAIHLLKHHQASGILVDCSDAVSEVSLSRLYRLPDYATELGAPWYARVAVVLPRSRYRLESYEFLELVCKNAGYHAKLFETKETAENWLAETAPVREHTDHPAHA